MTRDSFGARRGGWLLLVLSLGLFGCSRAPLRFSPLERDGQVMDATDDGWPSMRSVGEHTTATIHGEYTIIDGPLIALMLEVKNTSDQVVHIVASNTLADQSTPLRAHILPREEAIRLIESNGQTLWRAAGYHSLILGVLSGIPGITGDREFARARAEQAYSTRVVEQMKTSYWSDIDLEPSQTASGILVLELLDDSGNLTSERRLLLDNAIDLSVAVESDIHRFSIGFRNSVNPAGR